MDDAAAAQAREHAVDHAPAGSETLAYENPEAVLADETLAPEQKRRFLREWLERLQGADEGPGAAEVDGNRALADRVRRLLDAHAATDGEGAGGSY